MGKLYLLFTTFLLVSLFSFSSTFGQSIQKLSLTPSMVINESSYGDPGMLVDEQSIAGDPLNGGGGSPTTNWFPGYGDRHPVSAYIDLGELYKLSHIFLYDVNGRGELAVEYGTPGNWTLLFRDTLDRYQVWSKKEVTTTTQYLRFTRLSGDSNMNEVILYGSLVNAAPVLNTIEPQDITEGESLVLNLSAVDDDNDTISYSLSPSLSFISLTDNGNGTANLSMNPVAGDAGSYELSVTVSDGKGGLDEKTFAINVSPTNANALVKIILNPSMVINESSYGDPGMLVDEQEIAGDPLNGAGGSPTTNWFPGYGDRHPVSAYIDLGELYKLSHIFLYDVNGRGELAVEYGTPGNWTLLFRDTLDRYQVWSKKEVTTTTQYLRFTRLSGESNMNEVVIYGSATSNPVPVLEIIENQVVNEGDQSDILLRATDSEHDSLTFSLDTAADFISLINNGDGTAKLSITPGYLIAGDYEAMITVTNGNGGTVNQLFTVTVNPNPGGTPQAGDFRTKASGTWDDYTVWQKYDQTINNWVDAQTGDLPGVDNNVFIEKDHSLSLNEAATCKELNLNAHEDVRRLDIGENVIEVWGQLKIYSGAAPGVKVALGYETSPPGHYIFTEENSQGRLRFRGNSPRVILESGTGGASDALSGWTMEFAFDEGVTGIMDASLRMGNLIVSSGVLQFNNSSLRPSGWQLENATGDLLIKNGAKLKGGSGGFYKGSNTAMRSFVLEEGGFLEITDPNFTLSAQNVNILGTVIFSGVGNQFLLGTGERNYSSPINSYNSLVLDNGGLKSLRNNITIHGSLQELNGATLNLNGFNVEYPSEGEVPDNLEYQALIDFFNSTNGDGWLLKDNWLEGDYATWYGVCVENGDVVGLELGNNGLKGVILPSIANLRRLKSLNLYWNEISDLPTTIGELVDLESLDFDSNRLSSLPAQIGNLYNLEYLILHNNEIKNLPNEMGFLYSLRLLTLNENELSQIPDLSYLGNLSSLYLYDNNLSSLPPSIGNLTNLWLLNISENKLVTLPLSFRNLEHTWVIAYENFLPFKEIDNFFKASGVYYFDDFTYSPQSPPPPQSITTVHGSPLTLTSDDNASNNHYQWQKYINGIWTEIPGATDISYTIPSVTEAGQYRCMLTNDWVTDLTLYSQTFDVNIATEFWSVADGNWTDKIWATTKNGQAINAYPTGNSKVFIIGNNITVTDDLSCGPIELIVENKDTSLTVDGAEVVVFGDVKLTKTTEGNKGNLSVLNGGRIKPVQ